MTTNTRVHALGILFGATAALLFVSCASNRPADDANAQPETTSNDAPEPRYDGPPKYADWCTRTVYEPHFPGEESTDIAERTSKEFDDQDRLVVLTRDEDGDGEADSRTTFTYDVRGLPATQKLDRDMDGDVDREEGVKVESRESNHPAFARWRSNSVTYSELVLNEDGQKIGHRSKQRRAIGEGKDKRSRLVEEVGVYILNEQGLPTTEFSVLANRPDQELPDVATLRSTFVHDPEAGSWTWPSDADFAVGHAYLLKYNDAGQNTIDSAWKVGEDDNSVPDVDALLDKAGVGKPLVVSPDKRKVTAEASGPVTEQLLYLHVHTYERGNRTKSEAFVKGVRLSKVHGMDHDKWGTITEVRRDTTALLHDPNYAEGAADSVETRTIDPNGFDTRKTAKTYIYPMDAGPANIPGALRLVDVRGLGQGEAIQPDAILSSEHSYKRNDRGNLLEETRRETRGVRTYNYDSAGRVVEEKADGDLPELAGRSKLGVRYELRVLHEYDDAGHKTRTTRILDSGRKRETRVTDFAYDGDRLTEEVTRDKDEYPESGKKAEFKPLWKKTHSYDSDGRRIKTAHNSLRGRSSTTLTFEYDGDGRMVTERRDLNGVVLLTSYKHDDVGRVIEETRRRDGNSKPYYRIVHQFDEQGKRVRSLAWGEANKATLKSAPSKQRIIEYEYENGQVAREIHTRPVERVAYTYDCHESVE